MVRGRHEKFRNFCVGLAQGMYRAEVQLRTNLLGEPAKHVRPLSETKYVSFVLFCCCPSNVNMRLAT